MNERGSVVVYLLCSIAVSIGAGYGVYAYIRDHKSAEPAPTVRADAPSPKTVVQPQPVVAAPEVEPPAPTPSVAEQRAVNPIVDDSSDVSPVMGLPGIDGAIERGAVDRRFRAKSKALQTCFDNNGQERTTIHASLLVDERGHVTSARVSSGLSLGTESCVLSVLSSISFSPPGKSAEVVLPLAFR